MRTEEDHNVLREVWRPDGHAHQQQPEGIVARAGVRKGHSRIVCCERSLVVKLPEVGDGASEVRVVLGEVVCLEDQRDTRGNLAVPKLDWERHVVARDVI